MAKKNQWTKINDTTYGVDASELFGGGVINPPSEFVSPHSKAPVRWESMQAHRNEHDPDEIMYWHTTEAGGVRLMVFNT